MDYYQDFYDAFGDNADFMVATLNFQDYYDHLESDQAKLGARIVKLQADLEANPKSEKKQNQLRELSSQFETFDVRKERQLPLSISMVRKTLFWLEVFSSIPLKKLFISLVDLILSLISFMRQRSCKSM